MHATPSTPDTPLDPRLCPLCGLPNQCGLLAADALGAAPPCWCMDARIPAATLARIAPPALNRACLCPRCAAA